MKTEATVLPNESTVQGIKLSICISTLNRANFIGMTLDSILPQLTSSCEVVVLDAGSIDDTERLVLERARHFGTCIRYFKQQDNQGIDRDYDRTIDLARGEYCWLMTDDDVFEPRAVDTVMQALCKCPSLLVVNVQSRNLDMSRSETMKQPWLGLREDRCYETCDTDRLFEDVGQVFRYIGCLVIKRDIWLNRDRQRCYGTFYNYLSVIFQKPLPGSAIVIAEPLISYRWGNSHGWSPKLFEIRMVHLPFVVKSLEISEAARDRICSMKPWTDVEELLHCRALGYYSTKEYVRWIRPQVLSPSEALGPLLVALVPGVVANTLLVMFYSITRRLWRGVFEAEVVLQAMRESPFHLSRLFTRRKLISV